jgi:hypothetical protein
MYRSMGRLSCLLAFAPAALVAFLASLLSAADQTSFTRDIKPILDSKCVSCHACYESPAQLASSLVCSA